MAEINILSDDLRNAVSDYVVQWVAQPENARKLADAGITLGDEAAIRQFAANFLDEDPKALELATQNFALKARTKQNPHAVKLNFAREELTPLLSAHIEKLRDNPATAVAVSPPFETIADPGLPPAFENTAARPAEQPTEQPDMLSRLGAEAERPAPAEMPPLPQPPLLKEDEEVPLARGTEGLDKKEAAPEPKQPAADNKDDDKDKVVQLLTEDQVKKDIILDTKWGEFKHIMRMSDREIARIDARHDAGRVAKGSPAGIRRIYHAPSVSAAGARTPPGVEFENMMSLANPGAMAYIAAHYKNHERDPAFLGRIAQLSAMYGIPVDKIIEQQGVTMLVDGQSKFMTLAEIFQGTSVLTRPPHPNFGLKLVGVGIMQDNWYRHPLETIGNKFGKTAGLQYKAAPIMFVDERNNAYIDNGRYVTPRLAPGEKFGPEHALNMMRVFIAGRFNPNGQLPQHMVVKLDGGSPLTRAFGHFGKDAEQRDMAMLGFMVLAWQQNQAAGTPVMTDEFHLAKAVGFMGTGVAKLRYIYMAEDKNFSAHPNDIVLSPRAREWFISLGYPVDEIVAERNERMRVQLGLEEGLPIVSGGVAEADPGLVIPTLNIPVDIKDAPPAAEANASMTPAELARKPVGAIIQSMIEAGLETGKGDAAATRARLESLREETADRQATMLVYDHFLKEQQANGKISPEDRKAFFQGTMQQQEAKMIAMFPLRQDFYSVLSDMKPGFREQVDKLQGLPKDTAAPFFATIFTSVAVEKGVIKPEQMLPIKDAALLAQALARLQTIADNGHPNDVNGRPYPPMGGEPPLQDESPLQDIAKILNGYLDPARIAAEQKNGKWPDTSHRIRTMVVTQVTGKIQAILNSAGLPEQNKFITGTFSPAAPVAPAATGDKPRFNNPNADQLNKIIGQIRPGPTNRPAPPT